MASSGFARLISNPYLRLERLATVASGTTQVPHYTDAASSRAVTTFMSKGGFRGAGPPIDRLHPEDPNVLADFVRAQARPWGSAATDLSPRATAFLWTLSVLNLLYVGWLFAVGGGITPCAGLPCSVATLGGHPQLTLILAGACALTLAVAMPVTRGLTCANGPQLALVVGGAVCGFVAVSGAALLLFTVAAVLGLLFGLFVIFVDRF